ncbi:MAG: nucleotide sugar dehydrogenase, partial [Deltaproteobacteria bacterium]|nr:nucleotide sugar dehydrogenase [Deltaproteobacteria bacterium]
MDRKMPSQLAIVGLGYVGLPLATAFGRLFPTIGFDTDDRRVKELQEGYDRNGEIPREALHAPYLNFTGNPKSLQQADFIIVAVPTPIDKAKRPDLNPLVEASRLVGQNLKRSNRMKPIIVYESTVYPGCTEEVCIPILEQESGLKSGQGFMVGYSPERINPGDSEHTLEKVVKVVSAQDTETLEVVAKVYSQVAKAGVYKASDIRTAEAAKVIE